MGLLKGIVSIVATVWIYQCYQKPEIIKKIPRIGFLLVKINPYLVIIAVLILLNTLM